jgi:dinuclear metal center YbgI/SA1388 family protein
MAKLNEIVSFLNKELKIKSIKDSSLNGLQVKCKSEVNKIGFAVDACLSTFEKAKKEKVDLLIVHHGVKWKPQEYPKIEKMRLNFLRKNKISLYAAHLPLDSNPKYGNNMGLAKILNLNNIKTFAKYRKPPLGFKGIFMKKVRLSQVAKILDESLSTKSKILPFGEKKIKSIGIVSGGGSRSIEDAVKDNLDCLLVGEMPLIGYHRAKDFKLSIILSGHYATETVGVKALMPIISKRFKVKTVFIDNPTGI